MKFILKIKQIFKKKIFVNNNILQKIVDKFQVNESGYVIVKTNQVYFYFEKVSHFKMIILGNLSIFTSYLIYSITVQFFQQYPEYSKRANLLIIPIEIAAIYLIFKWKSKILRGMVHSKKNNTLTLERIELFSRQKDIILPINSITRLSKVNSSVITSLLYKLEYKKEEKTDYFIFFLNNKLINDAEFKKIQKMINKV